jgi:uncharacterized protein
MPIEVAVDADTGPARPAQKFWMLRGPAAYIPLTPWRAWAGSWASLGIFLGAVLSVGIFVLIAIGMHKSLEDVLVNIVGTLIQQLAMISLTLYAATRYGGKAFDVLALRQPAQGLKSYPLAFGMLILLTLFMNAVVHQLDPNSFNADVQVYKDMMRSPWWWLALILVGVGAPLSEELLCRGFLFSALSASKLGKWGAAAVTSLAFAIVHPYSVTGVIQVFMIGFLFAVVLIRTGSLRVTMVCHALYNTLMAALMMSDLMP